MRRILFFVLLSVLFHFLSWKSGEYFADIFEPNCQLNSNDKTIEIQLEEKSQNTLDQQLVRQPEIPKELEAKPEKLERTEFYSEQTQRVKVQTKAALLGLTKNRFYESQKSHQKKYVQSGKITQRDDLNNSILKDFSEYNAKNPTIQNERNRQSDLFQNAPSTVGEMLSDSIKVGEFTALNTDRHLFYTFYSRVEEAIRLRWENEVERTLNNLNKNSYHNPKSIWSTRLDIILSKEGKFIKAILLKESGIRGLDYSAINAFREANYFPHPPKEMIDEDGLIRLKYQFHVYFDPTRQTASKLHL